MGLINPARSPPGSPKDEKEGQRLKKRSHHRAQPAERSTGSCRSTRTAGICHPADIEGMFHPHSWNLGGWRDELRWGEAPTAAQAGSGSEIPFPCQLWGAREKITGIYKANLSLRQQLPESNNRVWAWLWSDSGRTAELLEGSHPQSRFPGSWEGKELGIALLPSDPLDSHSRSPRDEALGEAGKGCTCCRACGGVRKPQNQGETTTLACLEHWGVSKPTRQCGSTTSPTSTAPGAASC